MMGMVSGMAAGDNMPDSIREVFTNSRRYLGAMAEAKKNDLSLYQFEQSPQRELLSLTQGAQYLWAGAAGTDQLRAETETLIALYLRNFVVSEEQFYFFRETLRHAREGGARVIVYWPKVNPFLREAYQREPRIQAIWRRVETITREQGGQAIDLNEPGRINCDAFYDASHMSVTCFPMLAGVLLNQLD